LGKPQFNTLSPRQALMAIVPHTYGGSVLNKLPRAEEFAFTAQLSRHITTKSIDRPDSLALLPKIASDILTDVSNTPLKEPHH